MISFHAGQCVEKLELLKNCILEEWLILQETSLLLYSHCFRSFLVMNTSFATALRAIPQKYDPGLLLASLKFS